MSGNRIAQLALVAVLAVGMVPQAAAQASANYALPIWLLNAGVGDSTSTNYRLSASLGDPFFTGPQTSANFRMTHGLWKSVGGAAPPVFAGAVSRKAHALAGTFDLPLSLAAGTPTTEPRQGPLQTVVFTFDKPISAATVVVTAGAAVAGAPTFGGNDVVVALSGVNNQQYVTVGLTDVTAADGGTGGAASVRIGYLAGDVNGSRVVTVADLGLVNAVLAQPVSAANFLRDVNASGTLTVGDKGITNANLAKALPPP